MRRTSFWWRDVALALIALAVAAVCLRIGVSGEYAHFVKASMQPWLVGASVVMGLLAVAHLWAQRQTTGAHDDGHHHGHGGMVQVGALMLIPVLVLCLLPTPDAGPALVARKGAPSSVVVPTMPTDRTIDLDIDDYVTYTTSPNPANTIGRTVRTIGYISRPNPTGPWYVSRLKISCCIADALVFRAAVLGAAEDLPNDLWVEVEGVALAPEGGEARIQAVKVTPIPVPQKPLLT